METYTLLTHPITLLVLVTLSGAVGWNVRTLITLSRRAEINAGAINVLTQTSKDIKELLNMFIEEHRQVKSDISGLKTDIAVLKGEHDALHGGEKKRQTRH